MIRAAIFRHACRQPKLVASLLECLWGSGILIAVTGKRSGQEIDRLVEALAFDGETHETNRRLDRPHLQSASQSL